MIYDWFKIFNKQEFLDQNLISKSIEIVLQDIGEKTILVTLGETVSILVDGVFLSLELNGKNPFEFDSKAIFIDDNDDVYLGFLSNEN